MTTLEKLGVGALIGIIVAVMILLALACSVWNAWWLFPLWSRVMIPLGLPAVTFWQFTAVSVFIGAVRAHAHPTDYAKDPNDERRRNSALASIAGAITSPVLSYYFILWLLK